MLKSIRLWLRCRRYRVGRTLRQFIARDVRREVMVVGVDRIDDGIITVRIRTTNVLYQMGGLVPEQEFGPPVEMNIADIWNWTGQPWGGLADGTSLVGTHLLEEAADKRLPEPPSKHLRNISLGVIIAGTVIFVWLCSKTWGQFLWLSLVLLLFSVLGTTLISIVRGCVSRRRKRCPRCNRRGLVNLEFSADKPAIYFCGDCGANLVRESNGWRDVLPTE